MKSLKTYNITDKDNLLHLQFWDLTGGIMRQILSHVKFVSEQQRFLTV